jgi:hypothetical protein
MTKAPHVAFIRFVGGPLHNQHLRLPWFAEIMHPGSEVVQLDGRVLVLRSVEYRLTKITDFRGTEFFEFHCVGVSGCALLGAGGWFLKRRRFDGEKSGRIGLFSRPEQEALGGHDGRGAKCGGLEGGQGQPEAAQGGSSRNGEKERCFDFSCRCQAEGGQGRENSGDQPARERGGL